ncbi:MAG: ABC-2 transporter permease, partial [Planctomycetota bacterium]
MSNTAVTPTRLDDFPASGAVVWRALLWKEIRQIKPLVWMLVGLSALIFVIIAATRRELNITLQAVGTIIPLVMPALFAAGCGAILVGQEKESRTLTWLSSLPLPPKYIVTTKLVVAVGGLLIMWCASILLGSLVGLAETTASTTAFATLQSIHPATWFVHSIYVLLCGFYTSWRSRAAFPALLGMIPLAAVPFTLAQLWFAVSGDPYRYVDSLERSRVIAVLTLIALPVIGWLTFRMGQLRLRPVAPEKVRRDADSEALDAWRPPDRLVPTEQPFRHFTSAFLWQAIHGARLTVVALGVTVIIGAVVLWSIAHVPAIGRWGDTAMGFIGLSLLAVSWMGVSAFTGDGASSRLKFLADRGVRPTQAWLGRHLVASCVISCALLLYVALQLGPRGDTNIRVPEPSFLLVTLCVVTVYGTSQWVSQVLPMLAASALVAPVLSAMTLAWLSAARGQYGVSLGWLVMCGTIPWFATWLGMPSHMDGRRRWKFWSGSLLAATALIALPFVPVAIQIRQFPRMASSQVRNLAPEARRLSRDADDRAVSIMFEPLDSQALNDWMNPELDGAEAAKRMKRRLSLDPSGIVDLPAPPNAPLRADVNAASIAIDLATLSHLDWQVTRDADTMSRVVDWVELISEMASRLRRSIRWLDQ